MGARRLTVPLAVGSAADVSLITTADLTVDVVAYPPLTMVTPEAVRKQKCVPVRGDGTVVCQQMLGHVPHPHPRQPRGRSLRYSLWLVHCTLHVQRPR